MQLSATGGNAACDGFVDILDGGGFLFHTSGDVEVALCPLLTPAFDASAAGASAMSTASNIEDTTAAGGTIDHAHLTTSGSVIASQMTCGVGTGEVQFSDSLVVAPDALVRVTAFTASWTVASLT